MSILLKIFIYKRIYFCITNNVLKITKVKGQLILKSQIFMQLADLILPFQF